MTGAADCSNTEYAADARLVEAVVESIRRDSRKVRRPTRIEIVDDENRPVTENTMAAIVRCIQEREAFADIEFLMATGGTVYGFSREHLIPSYAHLCVSIDTESKTSVMAATIREESRLYPRPTCIELFKLPPYTWKQEEIMATLADIRQDSRFEDIQHITTQHVEIYLFSSSFLDRNRACRMIQADKDFEQNP